ncbi:hypothetical protein HK100_009931, partial [Physocladia obscura]
MEPSTYTNVPCDSVTQEGLAAQDIDPTLQTFANHSYVERKGGVYIMYHKGEAKHY